MILLLTAYCLLPLRRIMFRNNSLVLGIFATILCLTLGLGFMVSKTSYAVSFAVFGGIVLFIMSFVSTEIAIYVLIFATLLSPEFGARETHGGGVTLRTEDFLLVLIGFSQLARSALYKDVGLFRSTPLNRPIVYYVIACVFATGLGIMFDRVIPLTGFFFLLKYAEYYIVYFMVLNNLHTRRQAKQYLAAILLTCAIVCVIAMAQIPSG